MSQEQKIQKGRILSRVDTSENWVTKNPILLEREIGYETNGKYKIGDGIIKADGSIAGTAWNDLSYAITSNLELGKDNITDFSSNAFATGANNIAGGKAFKIIAEPGGTEGKTGEYKLDSVEGIKKGMTYSAVTSTAVYHQGTIDSINSSTNIVTVNNFKGYSLSANQDSPETYKVYNIFIIDGHPELGTVEIGFNAHAEGQNNIAHNANSHAEGQYTIASSEASHAEGFGKDNQKTMAIGKGAHAEGYCTETNGDGAHTEGVYSKALNEAAHAEGFTTQADGYASHSEGYKTYTNDYGAHAEGVYTVAEGEGAHAEGYGEANSKIYAEGKGAHAEGWKTQAIFDAAHAEGAYTIASGDTSHAEGYYTDATEMNQHVQGKYNYLDENGSAGNYAHIVGGGTSATNRFNIHTVDWNGNAWFSGTVQSKTFYANIGTSWIDDTDNNVKYQDIPIDGILESHTIIVDHAYIGSEIYSVFKREDDEYIYYITNGFAKPYDGGIRFIIFGDVNTMVIPIIVKVV